jgi:tRNA-intron endonuclease
MIKGILFDRKVIIENEQEASTIYNKGRYGVIKNKKLELSLVEALYLIEKNDIEVYDENGEKLGFDKFMKIASERIPRFFTIFSVYQDIRTRGYITKTALKYGADFRVYERGAEPGKEHAKWILYCVHESEEFDWKKFSSMNRVAHSVRKTLLIGVVDDEGDVTYWDVHWIKP